MIPAVNLQGRWGGKGGARSRGQGFAMPQWSCVPAQTDLPVTHLHFISPCPGAAYDQPEVSLFLYVWSLSSCFLPFRAAVWTSFMEASRRCQPPAEVSILNFDGTSLGIRSLLLMPALMPLCGLDLLEYEVPQKPVVPVWVCG